ncbi:MAG TPA: capsid/nuclear shuttle family protein [Patescibacteria group bacterium]|nr:MAG: capsid protein [Cressdnaviricota sp.]HUD45139.1 capsid/nuclear shuttle family protein [Patescibacteria group bacterium]
MFKTYSSGPLSMRDRITNRQNAYKRNTGTAQNRLRKILQNRQYNIPRQLPATLRGNKGEIKSVDIGIVTDTISTTATFQAVNLPVEGASFYNRIGRKVMMKSLRLTGQYLVTGNEVGVAEYLRVMVVYDRQTNGAYPVIGDLLANYDSAGTSTTNSQSGLNMNNAERFTVLMDRRIKIPYNTTDVGGIQYEYLSNYANDNSGEDRYIKLNNMETHYKATAGTIGDIATGGLYIVTFGSVVAGSAGYAFNWNARLRFHDN